MFNWLTIELSSRCNKSCSFCGRAKARTNNELELGDMDINLFVHIISQYAGWNKPMGTILQFSKDGEPLLYDHLEEVARISKNYITNIVTNGILLYDKAEIVNKFTSVCVSVIEEDWWQFEVVKKFVEKYDTITTIKFLGDYDNPEYEKLGLKTTRRTIHVPQGDWGYKGSKPVVPELGICTEYLNKPSINFKGEMFICNRYDPEKEGLLGDLNKVSIRDLWYSDRRLQWLEYHKQGRRDKVSMCVDCTYWGFPTNG